jgi:multisubunit Na+/H+ antiporter MnhC subunit
MNAFVTAVLIGAAMLAVAAWVEVRERRTAPGDQQMKLQEKHSGSFK